MSHTKMRALTLILFEFSPLMLFNSYSHSLYNLNTLGYNHDTSQLCRTGHDDVVRTRMTTIAFILSELFPLDGFRCNFASVL